MNSFIEFFQDIRTPIIVMHVISVVLGMGSALISDMLFAFFSRNKNLNSTEIKTLSILSKVVRYGLVFIILSGVGLFLGDMTAYAHSAKFLAKMSIVIVLLVNGYVLNRYIWPHVLNGNFFTIKNNSVRRIAFACGAISVISWLSACTLGVLKKLSLSYFLIMTIYFLILIFGILISQLVEKRQFKN